MLLLLLQVILVRLRFVMACPVVVMGSFLLDADGFREGPFDWIRRFVPPPPTEGMYLQLWFLISSIFEWELVVDCVAVQGVSFGFIFPPAIRLFARES